MKKIMTYILLGLLVPMTGFCTEERRPDSKSPVKSPLSRYGARNGVGAALAAIGETEEKGDDGDTDVPTIRSILPRQPQEQAWPLMESLVTIVIHNGLSVALEFLGYDEVEGTIWDKHPSPRIIDFGATNQFKASGKRRAGATPLGPKGTAKYRAEDGSFEILLHWADPAPESLYTLTFFNTDVESITCLPSISGPREITFDLQPLG
ncbi:MAG: hypothetical protein FJX18_05865 [Alphaproteobacteria bacterium]|nr:hypothetical protein [Alphaproteobacteria bacterium]